MSPALRPGARRWDAAALALVLVGGLLYLFAGRGLHGVATRPEIRATRDMVNLQRADRFRSTSYAGLLLALGGVGLGIYSFMRARKPEVESGA